MGYSKRLAEIATPAGIFLIAMVIVAIAMTIYFRTPMLKFFGFYEPDGFYHYSVIRGALLHGFRIPKVLGISGWPTHAPVTEPDGLYWVTLIPYAMLAWSGISAYTVERLVPILFGILDVIGVYFLVKYLSRSRLLGLLSMFFVALSGGDEARTSALIYRGDGFITIFLISALIAFLEVFRSGSWRRKLFFGLLSGLVLSIGSLVWGGAPFAVGVYAASFFVILAFAFVFNKQDMVKDLAYIIAGSLLWFVLTSIYVYGGWIYAQVFMGAQFLYILIPMVIGWGLAYLTTNRADLLSRFNIDLKWYLRSALARFGLMLAVMVVFVILVLIIGGSFINAIFVTNGFVTSGNSHIAKTSGNEFTATIQELQPPTPGFLFASFGINMYSTLPSLIIYLYSFVGGVTLFFLLILFSFIPYLFMNVYDSSGLLSGNARLRFDINPAMIIVLVYFALTAYLQMHAIRFNSLISVPIAILSAYSIYWLIAYYKTNSGFRSIIAGSLVVIFIGASIGTQAATVLPGSFSSPSAAGVVGALFIIAIIALLLAKLVYRSGRLALAIGVGILVYTIIYAFFQGPIMSQYPTIAYFDAFMVIAVLALVAIEYVYRIELWYGIVIVLIIYILLYYNVIYTSNLTQADLLNPQFFSALAWLKNNTANSSVVLTLWPDGSVVEGIANRTSVTDSVGSQNYIKADAFALWLLNSSDDPQFLTGNLSSRPNYLLVRNAWMVETGGIFQEANATRGANISEPAYSYVKFSSFSASSNASAIVYKFLSPAINGNVGLGALIYVFNGVKGNGVLPYLLSVNLTSGKEIGQLALKSVIFHNESSFSSTIIPSPNASAAGYSLLINYSAIPRNGSKIANVTGAIAAAPGLAQSNMFKFLYLCGYSSCPWNNNVASLQLVYANSDSRIFKINYNSTV